MSNFFLFWKKKPLFKENLGIFSKKNYFIEVKKTSLEKRIILGKEFFFSFTKSFLVLYQVFASLGRPTIKKLLLAFGLVDISSPRFFTLNQIEEWDNFFFHWFTGSPEDQLNYFVEQNLLHLQEINCFKGRKQRGGYPSRGQRTHSNASTARRLKTKIENLVKIT